MTKIMLIGGGNVGRGHTEYETEKIDKEIVKMTEKENPNFLFVGLASNFSDSYYDTMKKIYKELGCNCAYLKKKNILNNPDIVKNKIESADIIYFCGGDSIKLVNDLREYGIDKLLQEAIENNTVIAGMSAGAIMMCNEGYSDSLKLRDESDKYEFVPGLNFLDISFCPHYELDSDKAHELEVDLKKISKKILALPDRCAVKIIDDKYEIIRENNSDVYLCYYNDNYRCNIVKSTGKVDEIVL